MTAASGSVLGFILNALIAYTIVDVDAVLDSELVRMTFMSPSITIPPTHSYHLLTQLCDAFSSLSFRANLSQRTCNRSYRRMRRSPCSP